MTNVLAPQSKLIERINDASLSMAHPDVALRRPLADVVKAATVAVCKSPHTKRAFKRAVGEFILLLQSARGEILYGLVLVEKTKGGQRAGCAQYSRRWRGQWRYLLKTRSKSPFDWLRTIWQTLNYCCQCLYGIIDRVDGLTSWLDCFDTTFLPQVRPFVIFLAEFYVNMTLSR